MSKKFNLSKWQEYRIGLYENDQISDWSNIDGDIQTILGILSDSDKIFKIKNTLSSMPTNEREVITKTITYLAGELNKLV